MACSMLLSWPLVWLKFTMMLSRFFSACASRFSRSYASHVPSSQLLDMVLSPACLCDWAADLPLPEKIRLIGVQCVVSGSEQASDHTDILVNTWNYAKIWAHKGPGFGNHHAIRGCQAQSFSNI